jgi:hypothetical protein
MPYRFTFDLSDVSKFLFREVAKVAKEKMLHKKVGDRIRYLLKTFRIDERTGLNTLDALTLIEDLVDVQITNLARREEFLKTSRRALLLPHCSRKYMDNRCEASFDVNIPSYYCNQCSPDCLINQATVLGKERGYDVYVLPGGSCVAELLKKKKYEAIAAVACSEELKLGYKLLEYANIPGQAVPLIKNGCVQTKFNLESLERIL